MSKLFAWKYMLPLGHPAPQFGDSFPEQQLKIVATRGEIFSLKSTKYRFIIILTLQLFDGAGVSKYTAL